MLINLRHLLQTATGQGPQFGHESEDLDLTLLHWKRGHRIAEHVNNEVDVIMIVLDGAGIAKLNGETNTLKKWDILLIPKGTPREILATGEFSYLNIHTRRRKLQVQMLRKT